jgi:hypothetical protein
MFYQGNKFTWCLFLYYNLFFKFFFLEEVLNVYVLKIFLDGFNILILK